MKYKCLSVLFAVALLAGVGCSTNDRNRTAADRSTADRDTAADRSSKTTTETTRKTAEGTEKVTTETYVGEVREYNLGKSIKISTPGHLKKTHTFDLNDKDLTVNVSPNIKIGSRVKISEQKDDNGHKVITIAPESAA
jgi:hypothetical protein